ncbi:MAG: TRAP transporter substrate-binding protein DctP [Desulfatiglandaceae bacterium]|jgi:TRAP-type mannitol/chloroaromatic compound transport system substrate-binding protein
MKIRKLGLFCSFVMVIAVAALMIPAVFSTAYAAEYNWKICSTWGRGDLSMQTLAYFAQRVSERSKGRIKLEVFAEPEILTLPEVLPACSKGAIQMAQGGGCVWSMVVPLGDVVFGSLPEIWNFPNMTVTEGANFQRKWLFETGAINIIRKAYAKHNLYWLDMHDVGRACMLSTKEVHTLKDIKGIKLADMGGWMAQWHAALGWAPMEMLPASEMEMAIRLGTIGALDYDMSAITGFAWYKAAKYWVVNEGLCTHNIQSILVNKDAWKSLPNDLKKAVAGAAVDYYHKCNEKYDELGGKAETIVKSGKIIKCVMDKAYEKAAYNEARKLWVVAAKSDPGSAALIESIKKFRGIK